MWQQLTPEQQQLMWENMQRGSYGPGMMGGPVYHGANPEVCANVITRANQSPDPATRAYALGEAKKMGC